jgi:hypothetical protein
MTAHRILLGAAEPVQVGYELPIHRTTVTAREPAAAVAVARTKVAGTIVLGPGTTGGRDENR